MGRPPIDSITVLSTTRHLENNRYAELWDALVMSTGAHVDDLTWRTLRRAPAGPRTVVHLQWPEFFIGHRTQSGRLTRLLSFARLLLYARLRGSRVLLTLHNVGAHEIGRQVGLLYDLVYAVCTDVHVMSRRGFEATGPTYDRLRRKRIHEIPHLLYPTGPGDASLSTVAADGCRSIGFFGSGRGYKGLHNLLAAFESLAPTYRLRVVVNSAADTLNRQLDELRERDPRIDVQFGFLSDADLEKVIRDVDLIVLPFDRILNSGSVMQTLSLGRPVVVPWTVTFDDIGRRTGDGWVNTYRETLRASDIEAAFERHRDPLELAWCADETLRAAIVEMLTGA